MAGWFLGFSWDLNYNNTSNYNAHAGSGTDLESNKDVHSIYNFLKKCYIIY